MSPVKVIESKVNKSKGTSGVEPESSGVKESNKDSTSISDGKDAKDHKNQLPPATSVPSESSERKKQYAKQHKKALKTFKKGQEPPF